MRNWPRISRRLAYFNAKAKRSYGWKHLDGARDERTSYVTVLEIIPGNCGQVAIAVEIRKRQKR